MLKDVMLLAGGLLLIVASAKELLDSGQRDPAVVTRAGRSGIASATARTSQNAAEASARLH